MKQQKNNFITVVSGLPRSGTSLMMQMLQAGGMTLLTDQIRKPDDSNPKGFFEYEPVKNLATEKSWLQDAQGKVVKIVSHFLALLPDKYQYKIIFMERDPDEIIASQNKMLERSGKHVSAAKDEIKVLLKKSLLEIKRWLIKKKNIKIIFVSYNHILQEPERSSTEINDFLSGSLDIKKMAAITDKNLYRNRYPEI